MRIGHGYDVHRFGEGDHIMLAGVRVPFNQGIIAHSDGDVALHALCDALLGAAALRDIGYHFPDTDNQFNNIDSCILLEKVNALLKQRQFQINNIDITIIAQAPKLSPFIDQMITRVSSVLGLAESCINIKATTTEKLGYIGEKQGIAVHAVVLIMYAD